MFGTLWRAGRIAGWFLVQAARASYQELQVRHLLRGVQAQDVMAGDLARIPPDLTLQEAVDRYFMRYDSRERDARAHQPDKRNMDR